MVQLITNKKKKRGNTRVLRKELPMNIHLKKNKKLDKEEEQSTEDSDISVAL